MTKFAIALITGFCLFRPTLALADRWIPYTDGRAGGCFISTTGVLYGCTPQVQNSQNGNGRSMSSEEDRCRRARQNLKNSKNDSNRTITSVRNAEARFERTGCEEVESSASAPSSRQSTSYPDNSMLIEQKRRDEEERARLVAIGEEELRKIQMAQDARREELNRNGPRCDSPEYLAMLVQYKLRQLPGGTFCEREDDGDGVPSFVNCPPCNDIPVGAESVSTSDAHADEIEARDYDTTLAYYEGLHPRMNPDSVEYEEQLAFRLGAIMQTHMSAGYSRVRALRLAIIEVFGPTKSNEQSSNKLMDRWAVNEREVVDDLVTALQWTQRDNLADIDWNDAVQYCSLKPLSGGGWRLPTMAELGVFYAGASGRSTKCGDFTCKITPIFHLTGPVFWSSELSSAQGEALSMDLTAGEPGSFSVSFPNLSRALCVRSKR